MSTPATRPVNEVETSPAFARPVVVISKCLEFDACRYNGQKIPFDLVRELEPFVTYRPVCPEVEVGLGVPRDAVRLVVSGKQESLVQPTTGRDVTSDMRRFATGFLRGLGDVDGFILKSRSPTCGIGSVKVYHGPDSSSTARHSPGLFAREVLASYPTLAIEDEGRLRNYRIREHFFTKLFALARLREVESGARIRDLVDFQARYKFVLMAYSEKHLRLLGRIVANPAKRPFREVIGEYREAFGAAMARAPRYTSVINVFQHVAGHFRDVLSPREKAYFRKQLARYRDSRVPGSAVASLLQGWAVRVGSDYLLQQAFFDPFPEGLVTVADSGKGRSRGR